MNIDSIHEMTASTVPLGVPKGPTIGDDEQLPDDENREPMEICGP